MRIFTKAGPALIALACFQTVCGSETSPVLENLPALGPEMAQPGCASPAFLYFAIKESYAHD
jgi:hypothetical protein